MVTRSQIKRNAEEELVGTPNKFARSSDRESPERLSHVDDGAPNSYDEADSKINGKGSKQFGKQDASADAGTDVNSPMKKTMQKAAAVAESEHTPNDLLGQRKERSESQQKQYEDEHLKALEFDKQLQLIIEKRRAVGTASITAVQALPKMEKIAYLCEVASSDEIRHNMFLTIFTTEWWDNIRTLQGPIKELQGPIKELQDAAKDVEHYEQTLKKASEAFEASAVQRGVALLGDSPNGQEASEDVERTLHERVSSARRECDVARNNWDIVREQQTEKPAEFNHVLTKVLNEGEQSLVDAEYLRHWCFGRSQDSAPARPRRPRRTQSDNGEGRQSERAAQQESREQKRNSEPLIVEDIVAGLRNDQCRELERTRLAYNTAVEEFAAVRSTYYRKLADVLNKQNQRSVCGTRTEFDKRYFIERNPANRAVAMARDMYDFALEEADKTGALSIGQRVWAFHDEADGGRGSGKGRIVQVLRDMIDERIESWRQNEEQEAIASERHWPAMLSSLSDEDGVSLAGLSQWSEDQGRATGKRSRLIDDWKRQQEKVRKKTAFAVLPTMAAREAMLQWYEGFEPKCYASLGATLE